MKAEEYIVIQGWMYQLPLTEKQRVIYALVWGYSRDGRSVCRASAKQLAEWAGCQERNAKYLIRQLEDLGLVDHRIVSVPQKGRRPGGRISEFWAVLQEDATRPETKDRIDWVGRSKVGQNMSQIARPGRATDCTTPYNSSNSIHALSGCCGKNNARRARSKTTTTTGFLFEEEILSLPFEEDYFREAWQALLREPQWQGKTPGQLEQQLQRFRDCGDVEICCYAIDVAIRRGWDFIDNPTQIGIEDGDKTDAFVMNLRARQEGGNA